MLFEKGAATLENRGFKLDFSSGKAVFTKEERVFTKL